MGRLGLITDGELVERFGGHESSDEPGVGFREVAGIEFPGRSPAERLCRGRLVVVPLGMAEPEVQGHTVVVVVVRPVLEQLYCFNGNPGFFQALSDRGVSR